MELVEISYINIRGFYDTTLPLGNEKALIVGRNHAGKTSALLLLAWVINEANPDRLYRNDTLTEYERALLLPARSAHHRARRISLTVHIPDGRVARRFEADHRNNAILRIDFRVSGTPWAFIQLGEATRTSGTESAERAYDLLKRIQAQYSVIHIPSARDATSRQFQEQYKNLYRDKLVSFALHPGTQSGATSEYRAVVAATNSLKETAETILNPILGKVAASLPYGLLTSPKLTFQENSEQSVVDWIVNQITLKLVTGDHDDSGVEPPEVGAGLQSVLHIAAASVILGAGQKKHIVAVEEPEAFLHPSLQRTVARRLLSEEYGYKTLVSTHSPFFVEEARYKDLLLAVDGTIRVPRPEDSRQSDIHSGLLRGHGAEMIFADSVLLVEGEGDRAFFEGLRRRLATRDSSGRVDNIYVVPVGGKTSFGPWIRLLNALNNGPKRYRIRFLAVPDGDATKDIVRALRDSGVSVPQAILTQLGTARSYLKNHDFKEWRESLRFANKLMKQPSTRLPLCFLDGDLEGAMFSKLSDSKCKEFANSLGFSYESKDAFVMKMGSKTIDGTGRSKFKAPYIRQQLADVISFSHLSDNVQDILLRCLVNAGIDEKHAKELLAD